MLFRESISIALTALCSNKLRSVLTMLGIIIGVAAVIIMIAIGMGVKKNVTDSIASLGSNMLIVTPGSTNSRGVRSAAGSGQKLKLDDATAIKKKIKNIDYVAPTVNSAYQIVNGNENWNTSVYGVTPEYLNIRSLIVTSGSFISQTDLDSRNRVAVIGPTVASNLFGTENPVGHNIRINNQPFKVIGVLEPKGQASMGGDQDDVVLVPLTTAQERLMGITFIRSINIQVSSPDKINEVQSQVEALLRQRQGRRLYRQQPDKHLGNHEQHDRHAHSLSRQYRRNFPHCRRHRHHEYHDGIRHGTDKGDRHPQGIGRNIRNDYDPISHRSRHYRRNRRFSGYSHRHRYR